MISRIIRTILFKIAFGLAHIVLFAVYLPSFLLPRKTYMAWIRFYTEVVWFLERVFLDLDYELRGLEHLPATPPYIIAAKHQSAYETFKLHIMFGDPAVILKKELLRIPFWGQYLAKTDVIAIDRSSPEEAIRSIQDGARRVVAQGRPIVIFPQGTRVNVDHTPAEKPYKVGIARIQEAVNMPIIPVATNSGYFSPRRGFLKRPGKVVFEFLEPIPPGLERADMMKQLEERTESASNALLQDAIEKNKQRKSSGKYWLLGLIFLASSYSAAWFKIAQEIQRHYAHFENDAVERIHSPVRVSGFPFAFTIETEEEKLRHPLVDITLSDVAISGLPLPGSPVQIQAAPIVFTSPLLPQAIRLEALDGTLTATEEQVTIQSLNITYGSHTITLQGDIHQNAQPWPEFALTMRIPDYKSMLQQLITDGLIEQGAMIVAAATLSTLEDKEEPGTAIVPLRLENGSFFIGPLRAARLPAPAPARQDSGNPLVPAQSPPGE